MVFYVCDGIEKWTSHPSYSLEQGLGSELQCVTILFIISELAKPQRFSRV